MRNVHNKPRKRRISVNVKDALAIVGIGGAALTGVGAILCTILLPLILCTFFFLPYIVESWFPVISDKPLPYIAWYIYLMLVMVLGFISRSVFGLLLFGSFVTWLCSVTGVI